MEYDGTLQLEGLDEVFKALDRASIEAKVEAFKGLQKCGLQIIADAQDNLRAKGINNNGHLSNSGIVQKTSNESLDVGFFDGVIKTPEREHGEGYAAWVEYGRKAGKMPPPDELAAWAYKKFHLTDWTEANGIGLHLAWKIAKKGTKPHPFFGPAVEANTPKIIERMKEALGI